MASLSSAYWLTTKPGWEDEYDITVYQYGWRLGGKAASGRNQRQAMRTEEHGFHMLFGFYENTFRTMRDCMDALDRSPDAPLSRFCAATAEDEERYPNRYVVKRNGEVSLGEVWNGETKFITLNFPNNDLLPGDGPVRDLWQCLRTSLSWMRGAAEGVATTPSTAADASGHSDDASPGWLKSIESFVASQVATVVELGVSVLKSPYGPIAAAEKLLDALPAPVTGVIDAGTQAVFNAVAALVRQFLKAAWAKLGAKIDSDWEAYRNWIFLDFVGSNIIGVLEDNLLEHGFASINDQNYYQWLLKHAPVPEGGQVTSASCLVAFAYDACFAYRDGDSASPGTPAKPPTGRVDIEAGTMLHGGVRLFLTYKGALDWLFQAGCGDAIVAPIYELLQRRGVHFEFFHRVQNLGLSDDEGTIDTIDLERQVTLNVDEYQPLIMVNGLPSWPSEPLYDQIIEGDELQELDINLESFWTEWKGTPRVLRRGEDFDLVILGISIAALPPITAELSAASRSWRDMLAHVKTTRTFGFQTWANEDLAKLGWENGSIRADTGAEPAAMQADATQVIAIEAWPAAQMPQDLSYFGGVMKDDPSQPPAPDPAYPPTQDAVIREAAINYLNTYVGAFWPDAVTEEGFRWELLVDLDNPDGVGVKRFDSQFWKANIDPSERYVLSVTGSTQYRLPTDGSDFANLILTGDWIKNGIDSGCMEATIMSGMQASRAICGVPEDIPGEGDLNTLDDGTTW